MDTWSQNKPPENIKDKKAKLESKGYRTSHLSELEIEELIKLIGQERPVKDWRSTL